MMQKLKLIWEIFHNEKQKNCNMTYFSCIICMVRNIKYVCWRVHVGALMASAWFNLSTCLFTRREKGSEAKEIWVSWRRSSSTQFRQMHLAIQTNIIWSNIHIHFTRSEEDRHHHNLEKNDLVKYMRFDEGYPHPSEFYTTMRWRISKKLSDICILYYLKTLVL